ncbi:MAG TPA: hypothetical protein VFQ61_33670 [Polyangiaceae bacterium]|nr:hypothetical protein [Polyangiaceae bacterium]
MNPSSLGLVRPLRRTLGAAADNDLRDLIQAVPGAAEPRPFALEDEKQMSNQRLNLRGIVHLGLAGRLSVLGL